LGEAVEHAHDHDHGHAHGHGHGHAHGHGHGHGHGTAYGLAFGVGIGLNLVFVAIEIAYGVASHSLALVADAGHNFGDVLALALSLGAVFLARLKPSSRRTFGFRRSTIVASVANALILLFVTGGLAWESLRRLMTPERPEGRTMIGVALVGVVVNAVSALLFMKNAKEDLNLRSAFLHLASDAVLAFGVAVTGAVILATDWVWLDPAVSVVLTVAILAGTWSLMRKSMNLMLDAVPEGIDPSEVKEFLRSRRGVVEVHDLHIWAMSTTETALTAHVVMPTAACAPSFLAEVTRELGERFRIHHATLQVDPEDAPAPCALAPDEIV
jgi:cobalt-zinc-cadmium efflux system protein